MLPTFCPFILDLKKKKESCCCKMSDILPFSPLYYYHLPSIRRRSDYIIGFVAPAIGPKKSKTLTRLIAPAHNIHGKVWMKNNIHCFTDRQTVIGYEAMYVGFHSNFAAYIVCRRYKPCEFPGFVWTDCWGNKSYYVIISPANWQNEGDRRV